MKRTAEVFRKTSETEIALRLNLDGTGVSSVNTGIPFFDHMLTLFSRHGLFDLEVTAKGDLEVDLHHTVEDTGLALGQAIREALGDKSGIRRYGFAYVPMDESLARVVLDLSGRPYLAYEAPARLEPVGSFSFQLVEEFLRALSNQAAMNLHCAILAGTNSHHMAEAVFKALGRALDAATERDQRMSGVPSTKGVL